MNVDLTISEFRHAGYVGIDRMARALYSNLSPNDGIDFNDWQAHVLGAWGECVIAKAAGLYFRGDNSGGDRGCPDVGAYHVRTVDRSHKNLIIRRRDHDGRYVLVTMLTLPRFEITGWCNSVDHRLPENLSAPNGRPAAWFVPRRNLLPWAETPS